MILAIETSATLCSVVFWEDDNILVQYNHNEPMQHARLLGQLVEKGLAELGPKADSLSAVAVAIGPGSFTGLRIGLSYAQGFCFGKSLPLVGVSNHQVLACQAVAQKEIIFSIIDARRGEVYLAEHLNNDIFEIESLKIIKLEELDQHISENSQLVSHADIKIPEGIPDKLQSKNIITNIKEYDAVFVAGIGQKILSINGADDLDKIEPLYIRPFSGVH